MEKGDYEDESEKEQKSRLGQREIKMWVEAILRLAPRYREAWYELCDYLMRGVALDSDFVSKMLGTSQPDAQRMMLSFRSAGLIGVAKIPNYAYGEGYQYLYYSQNRTIYGGGVLGYLRKRIYEDLTGREVAVSLLPKDAPTADIILQSSYPLVIHVASSSSRRGLRLSALKERIRKVADEFSTKRCLRMDDSTSHDADSVIVVTLWKKVAEELNEARQKGELKGCLCVIPFAKKSVDNLADYALSHISLTTVLGEEEGTGGGDGTEGRGAQEGEVTCAERGEEEEVDGDRARSHAKTILEGVLAVVRELGGVQPCAIAERLGVPLFKVSRVAKKLKEEGAIKIAANLPYLASFTKPNSVYYLDTEKSTALHDTLMNELWKRNIDLGGKCRDYAFELRGKIWHTDGLLENTGGQFLLEVVAGECSERIVEQIRAYMDQLRVNRVLRRVIVVVIENSCQKKLRGKLLNNDTSIGASLFITSLRSRTDKEQLESLLKHGDLVVYHRNPT